MTSRFSRIALAAACAAGLSGLVAGPAAATINTPVVTPATSITPESAVIGAAIDTGNVAPGTSYTFEYDTLSDYNAGGDNAQFAGPFFVDASTGLQFVTAPIGCYPSITCGLSSTALTPDTEYVYFVQTQPGVSGTYSNSVGLQSANGEFKTGSLGALTLGSTKLAVARGKAAVSLRCTSSMPCQGTLAIIVGHKSIAAGKFSVPAGGRAFATARLKAAGKAALAKAGGTLQAKLAVASTTDQKNISKAVTLVS